MNLTFVCPPPNLSGGMRVIAIYASRLRQMGHTVEVVAQAPAQPALRTRIKSILTSGVWKRSNRPDMTHFDTEGVDVRIIERHRSILDGDVPDADVVLATFFRTGPAVAALSPAKGAKAFFVQGYEYYPGVVDRAAGDAWRMELDAAWRLPLRKITISKWLQQLAVERFGDPPPFLVPNAVDTSLFWARARSKAHTPTIGFLYSDSELKGCDVALEVIERIRRRFGHARAIAFGACAATDGPGLPDTVEYTERPPQHRIRQIYAGCDVWITTSRSEGFHLPPLEAMACGCPVVSTKVGGSVDIVRNGENGYLVDIDDVEALADRACHILSLTPSEWQRYSKASVATAQEYSWDDAAKLMERALNAIARGC